MQIEGSKQEQLAGSAQNLHDLHYEGEFGVRRPRFKAIPVDHHPLTCQQVTFAVLIILGVIGVGLGIMLGFLAWAKHVSTNSYVKSWAFVATVVFTFYMIAFYIGGRFVMRERRQVEKDQRKKREEVVMTRKQLDQRDKMFRF